METYFIIDSTIYPFFLQLQGFPKWKRNVNHIWQVLLFCRKVIYKLETGSGKAVNQEAAQLYERDLEGFRTRVRSCVIDWKERLYSSDRMEQDGHYFFFSQYQPHIHDSVRQGVGTVVHFWFFNPIPEG